MTTTQQTHNQRLTKQQYQRLLLSEGARRHRASTSSHFVFFLPHRNMWLTARASRRGDIHVRFYARCPCEDE